MTTGHHSKHMSTSVEGTFNSSRESKDLMRCPRTHSLTAWDTVVLDHGTSRRPKGHIISHPASYSRSEPFNYTSHDNSAKHDAHSSLAIHTCDASEDKQFFSPYETDCNVKSHLDSRPSVQDCEDQREEELNRTDKLEQLVLNLRDCIRILARQAVATACPISVSNVSGSLTQRVEASTSMSSSVGQLWSCKKKFDALPQTKQTNTVDFAYCDNEALFQQQRFRKNTDLTIGSFASSSSNGTIQHQFYQTSSSPHSVHHIAKDNGIKNVCIQTFSNNDLANHNAFSAEDDDKTCSLVSSSSRTDDDDTCDTTIKKTLSGIRENDPIESCNYLAQNEYVIPTSSDRPFCVITENGDRDIGFNHNYINYYNCHEQFIAKLKQSLSLLQEGSVAVYSSNKYNDNGTTKSSFRNQIGLYDDLMELANSMRTVHDHMITTWDELDILSKELFALQSESEFWKERSLQLETSLQRYQSRCELLEGQNKVLKRQRRMLAQGYSNVIHKSHSQLQNSIESYVVAAMRIHEQQLKINQEKLSSLYEKDSMNEDSHIQNKNDVLDWADENNGSNSCSRVDMCNQDIILADEMKEDDEDDEMILVESMATLNNTKRNAKRVFKGERTNSEAMTSLTKIGETSTNSITTTIDGDSNDQCNDTASCHPIAANKKSSSASPFLTPKYYYSGGLGEIAASFGFVPSPSISTIALNRKDNKSIIPAQDDENNPTVSVVNIEKIELSEDDCNKTIESIPTCTCVSSKQLSDDSIKELSCTDMNEATSNKIKSFTDDDVQSQQSVIPIAKLPSTRDTTKHDGTTVSINNHQNVTTKKDESAVVRIVFQTLFPERNNNIPDNRLLLPATRRNSIAISTKTEAGVGTVDSCNILRASSAEQTDEPTSTSNSAIEPSSISLSSNSNTINSASRNNSKNNSINLGARVLNFLNPPFGEFQTQSLKQSSPSVGNSSCTSSGNPSIGANGSNPLSSHKSTKSLRHETCPQVQQIRQLRHLTPAISKDDIETTGIVDKLNGMDAKLSKIHKDSSLSQSPIDFQQDCHLSVIEKYMNITSSYTHNDELITTSSFSSSKASSVSNDVTDENCDVECFPMCRTTNTFSPNTFDRIDNDVINSSCLNTTEDNDNKSPTGVISMNSCDLQVLRSLSIPID